MSADNLTTQFISDTYRRLLQLSDQGSYITDGTGSVVNLLQTTSSFALTASYVPGVTAINTSSFLINATVSSNVLTFTKGDGSTFNLTVNTGSGGGAETDPIFIAKSASLATTGSNTFKGNQVISGSLNVTSGITGSLFGTSSYATFAAAATTANFATSATQASTVRVTAQDTTTNAFKPFLLPKEVASDPFDPYYTRLDETPFKLNPAKNIIRFTPNETGAKAQFEIGNPEQTDQGQLVVYGKVWATELNVLPTTIKFVDTVNTASFNRLTDLSFTNNALILSTGSFSGSFIGNVTGTSSWANNYNETDPVFTAKSASFATTGSNQFKGNQGITGSLDVSGSFGLYSYGAAEPSSTPNRVGLLYFTNNALYLSLD